MKRTIAAALLLCLVALSQARLAAAQYGGKQAFDASYDVKTAMGNSTMRILSDGQGHERQEMNSGPNATVTILDYPGKVLWSLMPSQKTAMKMTMTSANTPVDSGEMAKAKGKPLGVKLVVGHPCHGWQTSNGGYTSECWVGDDIQLAVSSNTSGKYGGTSILLKSYSATKPNASLFIVPADYKVMTLPTSVPGYSAQ